MDLWVGFGLLPASLVMVAVFIGWWSKDGVLQWSNHMDPISSSIGGIDQMLLGSVNSRSGIRVLFRSGMT
ncbi:hypothetical protein RchiOBHm_Chr1g0318751 [Rosa chinensis]|uniref:Uncharacterized protein n=1 Tax=Rosa chinensis TaxID=74649 RepID=A0A2P6S880_ROSCH|nr:hypothetical protein RchiOBHm_Chr1g0318751 [Rosa chinensis]